jgi:hypothetical protein
MRKTSQLTEQQMKELHSSEHRMRRTSHLNGTGDEKNFKAH